MVPLHYIRLTFGAAGLGFAETDFTLFDLTKSDRPETRPRRVDGTDSARMTKRIAPYATEVMEARTA